MRLAALSMQLRVAATADALDCFANTTPSLGRGNYRLYKYSVKKGSLG